MALIIQKYGGTSVGSLDRIQHVADHVVATCQKGHQVIVVLSAMAGETNRLINLAHQIDDQPSRRELDVLMSVGEQISVSLLAIALIQRGYSAISLLADQVGIRSDNQFGRARIVDIDKSRLLLELEQGHVVIVAGFQGRDSENNITTLGRGGSDTTAVAIAGVLHAQECQIFTDVDGVYSADPRLVKHAKLHKQISLDDMQAMATHGAKVLQEKAVEYAGYYQVNLRVLSSFEPAQPGTLITYAPNNAARSLAIGVACLRSQVLIEISLTERQQERFFQQCKSEGLVFDRKVKTTTCVDYDSFALILPNSDLAIFRGLVETVGKVESIKLISDVATVSVVGSNALQDIERAEQFEFVLNQQQVVPYLYHDDGLTLSAVIPEQACHPTVIALHKNFCEE